MSRRIVYYAELRERWNITYCRVHLRRLMKKGKFPKAISLGANRIGWWEDEVVAWLESRPEVQLKDDD